ncbi:MAG: class I SAM-dependent rRNA methyltransferase [Gammaproteobacteria bacterium]|jgi:23S rRNA (cytosine1962-C5)-methyltransferase
MKKITIKPGFSKPFWAGNPLVYPKAIENEPKLDLGDWVCVIDAKHVPIAYGFYNPHSLYRVRLIAFANEGEQCADLRFAFKKRIQDAIALRQTLGLPSDATNAYRLINSEGDQFSGLTVDVLGDYLVAQVTAAYVMQQKELIEELLLAQLPNKKIIWRLNEKSLQQDGWIASPQARNDGENITINENGIAYQIDPFSGQKTGFYCDQRETRLLVRSLAHNKNVLDACCFNGGFALNAALGGAKSVTGVDTSNAAINLAKDNARFNHLNIQFIEQEALQALTETKPMDLIILDPPKLAPSHKHLNNAKRKYLQLNKAAINALAPNGYLLTCSCSQAMSLEDFTQVILDAAMACNKHLQIIKTGFAGPDHPQALAFTHGHYLKWLLVRA